MTAVYELKFIYFLCLTIGIEVPCLLLCLRILFKMDRGTMPLTRILAAGFLATFTTLPYVWFVLPAFIRTYLYYMITAELFALTVEAAMYTFMLKLPLWRGFILSLICNGVSFISGELVKKLFV